MKTLVSPSRIASGCAAVPASAARPPAPSRLLWTSAVPPPPPMLCARNAGELSPAVSMRLAMPEASTVTAPPTPGGPSERPRLTSMLLVMDSPLLANSPRILLMRARISGAAAPACLRTRSSRLCSVMVPRPPPPPMLCARIAGEAVPAVARSPMLATCTAAPSPPEPPPPPTARLTPISGASANAPLTPPLTVAIMLSRLDNRLDAPVAWTAPPRPPPPPMLCATSAGALPPPVVMEPSLETATAPPLPPLPPWPPTRMSNALEKPSSFISGAFSSHSTTLPSTPVSAAGEPSVENERPVSCWTLPPLPPPPPMLCARMPIAWSPSVRMLPG